MQLISQLQEASDLPLEQVVPAMKKDKRVNQIFKKLEPDDVDDWKTLIATLKYYFFNNQNVVRYLDTDKEHSEYLSRRSFRYLRGRIHKNEVLDRYDLELIRNMVNALPKELEKDVKPQARSGISNALDQWLGGSRPHMTAHAAVLFASFPSVRPKKPVVVYRGVMFNEKDLSEEPDYNGTMTVGSGVKFLRSMREGKRIADLEWDEYTSWTTDPKRARNQAMGNEYSYVDSEKMSYRGRLGFVITMLADPKDIVVDSRLVPAEYKYVPADTIVVKPGKYTCRVIRRFSPTGEEDVLHRNSELEGELENMEEMLTLLNRIIKLPYPYPEVAGDGISGRTDVKLYAQLIKPEAAEKIDKVIDQVHAVFNEHLQHIDRAELEKAAGGRFGKIATAIKGLQKQFTDFVTTKRGVSRYDRGESAPRHTVPASTARLSSGYSHSRSIRSIGAATARYRDWSTGSGLIALSHLLGVPILKDSHQRGHKDQQKWLSDIIAAYSKQVRPIPSDNKAGAAAIAADTDIFMQNVKQLGYLKDAKELLAQLEG